MGARWTKEEDAIILQSCESLTAEEVHRLLPGRSLWAVKARFQTLQIKPLVELKHKPWSEKEDSILKAHYHSAAKSELLEMLPSRAWHSIVTRAGHLKVKRQHKGAWHDWEIKVLQDNYNRLSTKEIAKLLPNRTTQAVIAMAFELDISQSREWTKDDEQILQDLYGAIPAGKIGEQLSHPRPGGYVIAKARKMGLSRKREKPHVAWTKEEEQVIRSNYGINPVSAWIGLLPGRTHTAISIRAIKLGLQYQRFPWEEWEEDVLRENHGVVPLWDMAKLLPGRSAIAIGHKARSMGLHLYTRWSAEEEAVLRENYGKMTSFELSDLLPGRSPKSVCAKATELGIRGACSRQWSAEEDEIVTAWYKEKPLSEIVNALPGRTAHSIRNRAQVLEISSTYKYSADREFFAVPNRLNSYWAGFIAADGCITGKQTISIMLRGKDADHLRRFAADASFTGKVDVYDRIENKFGKEQVFSKADIKIHCAPEWIHQLEENFGIGRRKSLTMKPPRGLSKENALAFIAGYFDGDGWFTVSEPLCLTMGFCGTFNTMVWIQEHCDAIASPASLREGSVPGIVGKLSYYTVSGRRAVIIAKEMLRLRIPRLDRKWDKVARRILELREGGHYQANLF